MCDLDSMRGKCGLIVILDGNSKLKIDNTKSI